MAKMAANSKQKSDGDIRPATPENGEGGARWRRRKAARPQEILDAALTLFAQKGEIYQVALDLDAKVVHPPQEDGFAPGYYSVLFEDPDGIRIEANFVPGKGHLEPGVKLPFAVRPL